MLRCWLPWMGGSSPPMESYYWVRKTVAFDINNQVVISQLLGIAMFGDEATDRSRQSFADQFEADVDGFIYRKSSCGAPIKVSAAERDRYIAGFNRFLKYWFWGIVAGILGLSLVAAFYLSPSDDGPSGWIGVALIAAVAMIAYLWGWNAPARELRGRGTVGAARSKAEIRRRHFEQLTYGQIIAMVVAAGAPLYGASRKHNLLLGWNRLWLAFGAFIVVMALISAFRKYRFDSQRKVK